MPSDGLENVEENSVALNGMHMANLTPPEFPSCGGLTVGEIARGMEKVKTNGRAITVVGWAQGWGQTPRLRSGLGVGRQQPGARKYQVGKGSRGKLTDIGKSDSGKQFSAAVGAAVQVMRLAPADLTPTEFPTRGGLTVGEIAGGQGTLLVGVGVL